MTLTLSVVAFFVFFSITCIQYTHKQHTINAVVIHTDTDTDTDYFIAVCDTNGIDLVKHWTCRKMIRILQ